MPRAQKIAKRHASLTNLSAGARWSILVPKNERKRSRAWHFTLTFLIVIALSLTVGCRGNLPKAAKGTVEAVEAGDKKVSQGLEELRRLRDNDSDEFSHLAQDLEALQPSRTSRALDNINEPPTNRVQWLDSITVPQSEGVLSESFMKTANDDVLLEMVLDTNTTLGVRKKLVEVYEDGDEADKLMTQAFCFATGELSRQADKDANGSQPRFSEDTWTNYFAQTMQRFDEATQQLPPLYRENHAASKAVNFYQNLSTTWQLTAISPRAAEVYARACLGN